MQNLRIVEVKIVDSSNISITFTHNLTRQLSTNNISIISDYENSPDSSVLSVKINGAVLSLVCQPLTPYSPYYLVFQSTPTYPFVSLNGDAKLLEDGVANKYLIIGPLSSDNIFQSYLTGFLRDNIYNTDDTNTVINKYLQSLSINLTN